MRQNDLTQIKTTLLKNFIICLLGFPVIMSILLLLSVNIKSGIAGIKLLLLASFILFGIATAVFNIFNLTDF